MEANKPKETEKEKETETMTIGNSRWDKGKMFFLSKEEQIEITSYEELFNCANQCLIDYDVEVDRFGRNKIDMLFVRLCMAIHSLCTAEEFKSLSCKKDGDVYRTRVEWTAGGSFEYDLEAVVKIVEHLCKTKK